MFEVDSYTKFVRISSSASSMSQEAQFVELIYAKYSSRFHLVYGVESWREFFRMRGTIWG